MQICNGRVLQEEFCVSTKNNGISYKIRIGVTIAELKIDNETIFTNTNTFHITDTKSFVFRL
jgi:hypothetical protein